MAVTVTCAACGRQDQIDPGDLDNPDWAKGWVFVDMNDGTLEGGVWYCRADAGEVS